MMKYKFSGNHFFHWVLFLGIFTAFLGLALYAYLGVFSRYGSDDYCNTSFFLSGDLPGQMIDRYLHFTNRFSNILFIGVAEKIFGWYNVAILPALMIALFVLGTYLFLKKIKQVVALNMEPAMILFLSVLVVFFSILQAPDLYQTLYWRASMATHFAPLVFMLLLGTFLLHQIGSVQSNSRAIAVGLICFIAFFLVGGFSEPPAAVMITVLLLTIFAIQIWDRSHSRRYVTALLLWSLAGVAIALILMAVSPSFSTYPQKEYPSFFEFTRRVITYPFQFIVDTLQTLPLPTIMSVAIPTLLFFIKYVDDSPVDSKTSRIKLGILMLIVLLLSYLLIAASFAPSAYGSSYPMGRARFAGRWIMTIALMLEGSLLGLWLTGVRATIVEPVRFRFWATLMLALLAMYPLRAAWRVFGEIPAYQQRAAAWDLRDTEIRALKAQGVQDLTVRFLSGELVQDLGDQANFRLNRCAAVIYGVDSIVARPMKK